MRPSSPSADWASAMSSASRAATSGRRAPTSMLTSTCGSCVIAASASCESCLPERCTTSSSDERGQHPVAGRGVFGEDHVAGLLAAERVAAGEQRLEHVAVADVGLDDSIPASRIARWNPRLAITVDDHRVVAEHAAFAHVAGADRDHVVAVDDVAALVDRDQAVGVAVEGDAGMRALGRHRRLQPGRVGRAAAGVDVAPVGVGVDHDDLRAGTTEHVAGDVRRGTVGGVDHDAQSARGRGPRAHASRWST